MKQYELRDGAIDWFPEFLDQEEADAYFDYCHDQLKWTSGTVKLFGREHVIPRKQIYFADPGMTYGYSGKRLKPREWDRKVLEIKGRIEALTGASYNACLMNLYRDGNDSNGWHADDEKELGKCPTIASVSLGTTRPFHLKHKKIKEKHTFQLSHGSLLVMQGKLQHCWKHQIPKSKRIHTPRVNLTFRKVYET